MRCPWETLAAHLNRESVHVCPQCYDRLALTYAAHNACLGYGILKTHTQTCQSIPVSHTDVHSVIKIVRP